MPSHYLNQCWFILSVGPLGTNYSETLIQIRRFSLKKMHLKTSSENDGHFVSASMRYFISVAQEPRSLPQNIPGRHSFELGGHQGSSYPFTGTANQHPGFSSSWDMPSTSVRMRRIIWPLLRILCGIYLRKHMNIICIFYHISAVRWHSWLKFFLMKVKDLYILYSQYLAIDILVMCRHRASAAIILT